MKRLCLALLIGMLLVLTACGNDNGDENAKENDEKKTEKEETSQVEVDKGLLNVEITLPPELFEGEDIESVVSEAEQQGVKEVIQNEDGSLTYKMSKSTHRDMMEELETGLVETITDMKNSEDYASLEDITHDKDFSEFTLVVDREIYENSFDGFTIPMSLGMAGMYYQLFSGVDSDDYEVTIFVTDKETQETFREIVLPDDLEEDTEEENEE